MPIRITATVSLADVDREIKKFEEQHHISSEEFIADGRSVPDDDAMEWNFLIMQKQALIEDDGCLGWGSFAPFESTVSAQEPRQMYDKIAA